jgi:hypothetical protein
MNKLRVFVASAIFVALLGSIVSMIVGFMPTKLIGPSITEFVIAPNKLDVTYKFKQQGIHQVSISVDNKKGVVCRRLFHIDVHNIGLKKEDIRDFLKPKCVAVLGEKGTHVSVSVSKLMLGLEKRYRVHVVVGGERTEGEG